MKSTKNVSVARWRRAWPLHWVTLTVVVGGSAAPIRWIDRAEQVGLSRPIVYGEPGDQKYILESTGTGVAVIDFDNDGDPDLFFVNGTRAASGTTEATNMLYQNLGDGRFRDVSAAAGVTHSGWGQGVCVGDIDNDGWDDLFVSYYGHNRLYRNQGDGTFEEVAREAGVAGEQPRWGSGCTFFDYDRDGDLDLFVGHYLAYEDAARFQPGEHSYCLMKGVPVMCGPTGLGFDKSSLFQNDGKGRFADVSLKAGMGVTNRCYALQPLTADFDEDGWPDLYLGCDATPNLLLKNNRDGTFAEIGLQSGVAYNHSGRAQASMGIDAADYDGNGLVDFFVSNFSDDTPTLYRHESRGSFEDVTQFAGLARYTQFVGWSCLFADFNLDGWKDLFIVNGHIYPQVDQIPGGLTYRQERQLYLNRGDGTFEDLSQAAGPGVTRKAAARGSAVEDFDGDGNLEIVIVNLNENPSYLRNEVKPAANWFMIELEGVRSNRSAIGSRVELSAGTRVQKAEVRSSQGYYSSSGLRLHFGLGAARRIDKLRVIWPDGQSDVLDDVPANRVIRIKEGEPRSR